ncbi:serine/threonine-protein phosphatase 2A regulatory subunit B'' subunit beta-like isoform X3 [Onychomys torridus]|uniref:serine/threonine-protein phosphatase 2A regulatory subunit B'' subunit beta-like isoform X3 n=1 Tax=Onychomys torridus TaxID=38674 RepID=UPI00167F61F1|nr:serine/threonine-protein phosphatase 2A regulatory subunit B'' subunit beta-like isoform X3 [Onychomys torridus]
MAPGKALTPVLKRKVDELFLRWLSDPDTQRALHDGLHRIRAAAGHAGSSGNVRHDPQATGHSTIFRYGPPAAGDAGNSWNVRHDPPWSSGNVRHDPSAAGDARSSGNVRHDPSAAGDARSAAGHGGSSGNVHQGLSVTRASKAPPPGLRVPAFFFPGGRPVDVDVDAAVARVLRVFARFPCERAKMADMGAVAKACGCPLYWKAPLFHAAGGGRTGSVSVHTFVTMWRKVLLTCHDDAAKFVQLLVKPGRDGLEQEDFAPFLQDVVNSHPGLSFLKEVPEFRAPYIATVTQRIFYTVNRSWSGRITCSELRRSRFLQSVSQLEVEPDINRMTAFFSLAHVRVIVCKFQELDTDGDLRLDARDLGRYADGGAGKGVRTGRWASRTSCGSCCRRRTRPRPPAWSTGSAAWTWTATAWSPSSSWSTSTRSRRGAWRPWTWSRCPSATARARCSTCSGCARRVSDTRAHHAGGPEELRPGQRLLRHVLQRPQVPGPRAARARLAGAGGGGPGADGLGEVRGQGVRLPGG